MKLGPSTIGNKIVTIIWRDAASRDDWHDAERGENPTGMMCCTTGFLLDENDHDIIISHTLAPQSEKGRWDSCCSIAIPKCCIYEAYECPFYEKQLKKLKKRFRG